MIKMHKMEKSATEPKKQRKPRKDKGISKLSTADKLLGVKKSQNVQAQQQNDVTSEVNHLFGGIISTFQDVYLN